MSFTLPAFSAPFSPGSRFFFILNPFYPNPCFSFSLYPCLCLTFSLNPFYLNPFLFPACSSRVTASGKVKKKQVPWPRPADSSQIRPR
jgi:hypothetical protein